MLAILIYAISGIVIIYASVIVHFYVAIFHRSLDPLPFYERACKLMKEEARVKVILQVIFGMLIWPVRLIEFLMANS